MKSRYVAASIFILSVILAGIRVADARQGIVDWHGAICQSNQAATTLTYDQTGVTAGSAGAIVVCPLQGFADLAPDKDGLWKVEIEMFTQNGSMDCKFWSTSDGGHSVSIPFSPTGGIYSSIPLGPVDEPVMPDLGGMPVSVSITCTMQPGTKITSIRLENAKDVTPPPGGAPLASQTP